VKGSNSKDTYLYAKLHFLSQLIIQDKIQKIQLLHYKKKIHMRIGSKVSGKFVVLLLNKISKPDA